MMSLLSTIVNQYKDHHVGEGIFMSCFMNMINFYLLKGQSEFLHVKQKQLPCFKVSVCISAHSWSSDSAIQVTCFVR